MSKTQITLVVDNNMFFNAASQLDRSTLGDRFVQLCLDPNSYMLQLSLLALYGIEITNVNSNFEDKLHGE